jgi:hypothetical protein
MSNVETVQAIYESFGRGDIAAIEVKPTGKVVEALEIHL